MGASRQRSWALLLLAVVSSLLCQRAASAQSPTREGTAQSLFEEATTLFGRGDYEHACDKFRASNELDPKGGTLLNLAMCREKQGRTASAWTSFSEARNLSSKEGRAERVAFADKKLAELKPQLPYLRIVVTERLRALEIKVDGEKLPPAAWSSSLPIDPGEHRIEATAPEHRPATVVVTTTQGRESVAEVPKLAPIPAPTPAPPAPPPSPAVSSDRARWPAYAFLGAGAVSIGVGSFFGVQAFSDRSDAESLCAASRCVEGRRVNADGERAAWIADIGIGLGALAAIAGVYWLTSTPSHR